MNKRTAPTLSPSVILNTVVSAVFHLILALSLYLHFAGHSQPGGGFIGGLVAGAALALREVAGRIDIHIRTRLPYTSAIGVGALLVTGTAAALALSGGNLLDHRAWTFHFPLLGSIKATSALFFDTGIYLLVVGVVALVLHSLGPEGAPGDNQ